MSIIWIDNDACPKRVRDIILKAGEKRQILVKLVANSYMNLPRRPLIEMICVQGDFNAADDYIADHVVVGDLVITADLPLADRVVAKEARAINPRGQVYTAETIKERLAVRNLAAEMRTMMDNSGGPSTFSDGDIKQFAAAFDRELTKLVRRTP